MKRAFGLIAAMALLIGFAVPSAFAQDASPMAGSPVAAESLLAGLGYPDLVITTDGTDFEAPADVAAGRYRLVVENTSDARSADIELYKVPEGMTFDEVTAAFAEAGSDSAPDIFYQMGIGGGASAGPGEIGDAIVDLTPGDWGFNLFSEGGEDEAPTQLPKLVTVTGEMPGVEDPAADVEVNMVDLAFEMPDTVASGPSVWKVTNSGAFPHFMIIESYPEPITQEQIQATLDAAFGMPSTPLATPIVMLNPDLFEEHVATPVLSTGMTNWIEVNLAPGQQLVACFVGGPGELPPHAAMGMWKLITAE